MSTHIVETQERGFLYPRRDDGTYHLSVQALPHQQPALPVVRTWGITHQSGTGPWLPGSNSRFPTAFTPLVKWDKYNQLWHQLFTRL